MGNCIFCKIVNKEINSNIVFEDDEIIAFDDIEPVAPVHVLIIPKKHIDSMNDVDKSDERLFGKIMIAVSNIAKQVGIADEGYRLLTNTGINGCQEVKHVHFHLIGGQRLQKI